MTAAYAVQFRPESLLILPVIGLLSGPGFGCELQRPAGWWVGVCFLVLVAIHVAHLFAVRTHRLGDRRSALLAPIH